MDWDNRSRSVWEETAAAAADYPRLTGSVDVEVAVVGSGYTGCSTALHLANAGSDVALIDASYPGAGASGRSAGWLSPHWFFNTLPADVIARCGQDRGRRLNHIIIDTSRRLIPELISHHAFACDYTKTPHVHASLSDRRRRAIEEEGRQWRDCGADVEVLEAGDIAEVVPSNRYRCGLRFNDAGLVNPLAYVRGLARAAASAGARLFNDSAVDSMEQVAGRWVLRTAGGELRADQVVLATNAYGGNLWPVLARTYVNATYAFVATAPAPGLCDVLLPRGQAFIDFDYTNLFSLRFDREGRLGTSTLAPIFPNYDAATVARQFMRKFRRIFPDIALPEWRYVHFGHTASQPLVVPRVYRLADRVFAANGYCANGIILATAMGRELCSLLRTGDENSCAFPVATPDPIRGAALLGAGLRFGMAPLARLKSRFV